MDDREFEDIVKQKLSEYEPSGFDPAALTSLHYTLDAMRSLPWHVRYRSEVISASAIATCALILFLTQWYFAERNFQTLRTGMDSLQVQRHMILQLRNEIGYLERINRDTAFATQHLPYEDTKSQHYATLTARIAYLESLLQQQATATNNVTVKEDHPSDRVLHNFRDSVYYSYWPTELSRGEINKDSDTKTRDSVKQQNEGGPELSAKSIRNIEKHYLRGVGIRVGPTFEVMKGNYPNANGMVNTGGGVIVDFITSPSLSIETGIKYRKRYYEIQDAEDFTKVQLPNIDPTLGTLKKASVDSWILEIPLNLKYRYPLSRQTHVLTGLGYSSLIYLVQSFEYHYQPAGVDDFSITSTYRHNQAKFYPGTLNFSLGISREFKRSRILETSLYYQYGLGGNGVEQIRSQSLGLRAVYWLKVR